MAKFCLFLCLCCLSTLSACHTQHFHKLDTLIDPHVPAVPKEPNTGNAPRQMPDLPYAHRMMKTYYGREMEISGQGARVMVITHPPHTAEDAASKAKAYCAENRFYHIQAIGHIPLQNTVSTRYDFACSHAPMVAN